MRAVCCVALAIALLGAAAPTARAQTPPTTPPANKPAQPPTTQPAQPPQPAQPEQKPDEPQKYEETVVVSASRTEEKLINAPATMTDF